MKEKINYQLPSTIPVKPDTYKRWLDRKAKSIKRRNAKKDNINHGGLKFYKDAIHKAVCSSNGKDFYTGEQLNWPLLSRFNNTEAKKGGSVYLRRFSLLPTVDHYDNRKKLNFVICSWRVNDAKNYMSHNEFIELCRKVIANQK